MQGHRDISHVKRRNSAVASDMGLLHWRSFVRVKTASSGRILRYLISSSKKTDVCSGDKIVSNISSFFVRFLSGRELVSPKLNKYLVTLDTSHVLVYRGLSGFSFSLPFIRRQTREC